MAKRVPEHLWLNGKFVPFHEARVHVWSPAFKYGAQVFEGIRGYWNEEQEQLYVFRMNAHYKRLLRSMKVMRMEVTEDVKQINDKTIELLKLNEFREDCHIRQVVFVKHDGYGMEELGPLGTLVSSYYHGRYDQEGGVDCCVSSWQRISDNTVPPRVKCGANYQNSRLALIQANMDGYDVPIFLNDAGKVSETHGSCLFIVRDNVPITTPVTSSILESITRATVMQLFEEVHHTEVWVREIDKTELYLADEVFVCGSNAEVTPVLSVDRYPVNNGTPGQLTTKISNTYFAVVRGESSLHPEWRTPVC